jgi:hypothetical protein
MARNTFIGGTAGGFVLEDVNGSFAKFLKAAPRVFRQHVYDAIDKTSFSLTGRIAHGAPVGPESPHLRDTAAWKRRGLTAQVGYLEGMGGDQQANPDAEPWNGLEITNALVAMFNEYGVKHHGKTPNPFMKDAALKESSDFVKRMKSAIGLAERDLSGGGGLL